MTLPASGPISVDQINVELGNSSNANLDLNSSTARFLADKSSGQISFNDFYGTTNSQTWISNVGVPSGYNGSVCKDSSGNVYVANSGGYITKLTSDGKLVWSVQYKPPLAGYQIFWGPGFKVDSSGYLYGHGIYYESGASVSNSEAIYKINTSDGTIVWEKKVNLPSSAGSNNNPGSTTIDTSGNVYCVFTPGATTYLVKLDNTGAVQWQRSYSSNGTSNMLIGFHDIDSSGNLYLTGWDSGYCVVIKIDSSGNLVWHKKNSTPTYGTSVAVEAGGSNVYVGCYDSSNTIASLVKFNSSGAVVWQKKITPASGSNLIQYAIVDRSNMVVDSSNNVYMVWRDNGSLPARQTIVSFDSAGNLRWSRILWSTNGSGGSADIGIELYTDSSYLYAYTGFYDTVSSAYKMMAAKLPLDGSKTGTYSVNSVSVDYISKSHTASDSSWTFSDNNGTMATTTFTINSGSTSRTSSTPTVGRTRI